ncbi:MAG: tetratricopeptide repeat protein, partial [Acidobacteriota bacterium]|nr:tetratricopeptide repeat protein [Acidobacteriota bacterium]
MNKHFFYGIIGLIVGLAVGFFTANSINRNAVSHSTIAQNPENAPFISQPTADIKEKPQGGMLPEISETLDRAKNEPNNFEAQIKAGDMYEKIQKFDTAVEFYEKANRVKPEDYETIVKIGNTYFDSKQFEKAEKWYAQALAKKPGDINVRTDFGITFVERENPDLDRAVKEFQT